jgi:hypothetical protein
MLEDLTLATFASREGEVFRLSREDGPALELVLVEARGLGGEGETREPFSLVFLGPAEPVLSQMIRPLEHPALGTLEIFLVPIGSDERGTRYEAVFT